MLIVIGLGFRSCLSEKKILKLKKLIFHVLIVAIFIVVMQVRPGMLQCAEDGFSAVEILIACLLSLFTVASSKLIGFLVGHCFDR